MQNAISNLILKANTIMLAFTFAFTGCASIPKDKERSIVKSPSSYKTSMLNGTSAQWPKNDWWKEYGDEQLNELIKEALKNSPDLAIATARLRKAEAFRQVANSFSLPKMDASASVNSQKMSYNYLTPEQMTPHGWNDYGQATLNFSFEIDFWGKNKAALAAATSELYAAGAENEQAKIAIVAAICSSYADLAQLYKTREIMIEIIEVRKKILELFLNRYKNGLETKGSLAGAEGKKLALESELLALDEQIVLQKNLLAQLVGLGPDRALSIRQPSIKTNSNIAVPGNLAMDLLGRRPDIIASRMMVEAYSHRIKQKKAEFYPNVNLTAFIGVQSLGIDKLTKSGSDIGSVGPAISLPIFTAGRLQGELRNIEAGYDEAIANYDRTLSSAFSQVANALISQRAINGQIKKAKDALKASTEVYAVESNRYKQGVGNYIQTLYAKEAMFASKKNLALLESRAVAVDVALKKALGGGYKNNIQG